MHKGYSTGAHLPPPPSRYLSSLFPTVGICYQRPALELDNFHFLSQLRGGGGGGGGGRGGSMCVASHKRLLEEAR